jgi:hypothetical protein
MQGAEQTGKALVGKGQDKAEDINEALGLVKDHPYLAQGRGYSIEAYRLP